MSGRGDEKVAEMEDFVRRGQEAQRAAEEAGAEVKPDFKIGKEKLSEFFDPKKGHKPVTRAQLQQILGLFASKADVHDGMQVLEFGLRRSIRQMIQEEREETRKEESGPRVSESGRLILPE